MRVELASVTGRVDVHPMVIEANGDGIQQGLGSETFRHAAAERTIGVIGGAPVVIADHARLRALRDGYDPRPEDLHDLALLREIEPGAGTPAGPES